MGGTDIYYCDWKGDYWDDPVNMGPEVNTKGNESYPTVNSEGGVFFSSDGHPGLGVRIFSIPGRQMMASGCLRCI